MKELKKWVGLLQKGHTGDISGASTILLSDGGGVYMSAPTTIIFQMTKKIRKMTKA